MSTDNTKAVKELLEIINNKVGKIEMRQSLQTTQLSLMKDQQSVMNEKLDGLQSGVSGLKQDVSDIKSNLKELNKKTDQIFKYASEADEDLQDTKRRIARIEGVPVIAHALK